ncbi:MAG: hypothetical protein JNN08_24505 [Bryobacterales bacterium]|nr:hypothetical protein [Bryobacterales bacterium]
MEHQKDFAEFCASMNRHGVDYLIVGGYAVAFHGAPRFTGDIDMFVRPAAENYARLLQALHDFGFPVEGLDPSYLAAHRKILQLGVPPVQIHLMSSISAVDFEKAWDKRVRGVYGGNPVDYIDLQTLLRNKRASGRPKDLADVTALLSVRRRRKKNLTPRKGPSPAPAS